MHGCELRLAFGEIVIAWHNASWLFLLQLGYTLPMWGLDSWWRLPPIGLKPHLLYLFQCQIGNVSTAICCSIYGVVVHYNDVSVFCKANICFYYVCSEMYSIV